MQTTAEANCNCFPADRRAAATCASTFPIFSFSVSCGRKVNKFIFVLNGKADTRRVHTFRRREEIHYEILLAIPVSGCFLFGDRPEARGYAKEKHKKKMHCPFYFLQNVCRYPAPRKASGRCTFALHLECTS